MASPGAEQAVKKLARLPSNTVCPNCGTSKKFGFSTVCIKYLTFVCNNCKSSHQAISHRCKSLTMSSWTDGEVLQLKTHGNDHARATWLANAPPIGTNGRPKEGDHIDVFKRFIVDAYERKKFYSEAGDLPAIQPAPSSAPMRMHPTQPPVDPPRQAAPPPPPAPAPPARAPASAPMLDLFSFDVESTPAPAFASTNDPFAPQNVAAPMPTPGVDHFGFGGTSGSIPPAPVSAPAPTFDPFNNSSIGSTVTGSLDTVPQPSPAPVGAKKPIMMNSSLGQSNIISSMESMMRPTSSPMSSSTMMGGSGNQINGFAGMGPLNNMSAMQQQQMHMMMMMQQQMGMSGFGGGSMMNTPANAGSYASTTGMMNNNANGFQNATLGFGAGVQGGFNSTSGMGPSQVHTGGMNYMQTPHGHSISSNFGSSQAKKNDKPDPFANLF